MSTEEVGGLATGHELITQALGQDGLRIKDGGEAIAAITQSAEGNLQLAQQVELVKEADRLGIIISSTHGQPLFSLYQYNATDFEASFENDDEYNSFTGSDDDSDFISAMLAAFYTFANIAADDLSADLLHGMVRVMALVANYNGNLPKDKWPAEFAQLVLDVE